MKLISRSALSSLPFLLVLSSASGAQVLDVGADAVRRFFVSSSGEAGAGQLVDTTGIPQVFRWTPDGGVEVLVAPGNLGGSSRAVSLDGSIVCGTTIEPGDEKRAIRWDASGTPLDLTPAGAIGSLPAAMSDDGLTVALTVTDLAGQRAAVWTAGVGIIDIHSMLNSEQSALILLSRDGSTAVGRIGSLTSFGEEHFVWSRSTGVVILPRLNGARVTPSGISSDGTFVSGYVASDVVRWSLAAGLEVSTEIDATAIPGARISGDGAVLYGAIPDVYLGGPNSRMFRWAPPADLEVITPPNLAVFSGSTSDGAVLSGTLAENQSAPGRPFHYTPAGGFVELDHYAAVGQATSISEDGARTGGTYVTARGTRAVVWSAGRSIGSSYCGPSVPNSTGASGTISARGTNISEFGDLTLTAEGLPANAFGFFIASTESALVAQPGGSQGNLCLGGAIGRFVGPGQVQNAGSTGSFSLEIDPQSLPGPNGPILPSFGETWHFQAWHRDANPAVTSNFTDAVTLRVF